MHSDLSSPIECPRTASVVMVLIVSAAVFSYLGAYAGTTALVRENLLDLWPAGADPRPRWTLIGFAILVTTFLAISALLRWTSNRQLQALGEDEGV